MRLRQLSAVVSLAVWPLTAGAEQFFATQVISRVAGAAQSAFFANPDLALGGPRGGGPAFGGTHVYNLGVGGSIVLGFNEGASPRIIRDLPGADFIIFENPLFENGDPDWTFAELLYVEVSSNGVDFARFPVISKTPEPVAAYSTISPADVAGFAGVQPVLANVQNNNLSPFDPLLAGGDAFDLSDLSNHPLVLAGKVNLNAIRQVRLIDVIGDGRDTDRNGRPIFDPTGDGVNGADIDAIAVIHGGPAVLSARLMEPGGGNFNDPSRWDTGLVPTGDGATADISRLGNGATLGITQPVSLARLDFGATADTLAGPAALLLDGGGDLAGIFAPGGDHAISSPIEFAGEVTLSAGSGRLLFTGPLTYQTGTSITISSGTVEFAVESGPVHVGDNVRIIIGGGSTFVLAGRINPLCDSETGQSMSMSFRSVPEPGGSTLLCLVGCILMQRRR